jgi:lysyl-tRNA synthetase class 2
MLEFYQAYADYRDLMDLTEDLLRSLCEWLLGQPRLTYGGVDIDFTKPFARLDIAEAILRYHPGLDPASLADEQGLRALLARENLAVVPGSGRGRLLMQVFEALVEDRIQQPTFIVHHPTEISPLARRNDLDPGVTDRFELYVAGKEIANGFSELNDAEDQAQRFHAQVRAREAGDAEALHFDQDYVTALEYGMPPTAGEGVGIDRLVMLLTDKPSIRDVVLFPHMRSRD